MCSNFKKVILLFVLIISSINVHALEIDEKLTCRFLKLSGSKKTILINRGAEDGLVVGDHAKFFITSGIIARGVVEKVSPSRSIWSIYRIVSPDDLVENKVVNLKIASPVKITEDPTKSLKEEPIEIAPGAESKADAKSKEESQEAEKINERLNDEDKKELEDMGIKDRPKKESPKKVEVKETKSSSEDIEYVSRSGQNLKSWEAYGTLSLNSMSGTVETSTSGSTSTSVAASVFDLSVGLEKYFFSSPSFKNISLFGLIYKRSMEDGGTSKTTTDWFQYGGGANYHFYNSPNQTNRLIGYLTGSLGIGKTTVKTKFVTGTTSTEDNTEGSNNFISIGVGAKYFVGDFGIRGLFDYNILKETFNYADGSTSTRSLSGPRVLFGLSYRF